MNFYKCKKCGNIIEVIEGEAKRIACCGEEMQKLNANDTDGAQEKHVPVYKVENDKIIVSVGEVAHPMEQDHYISFIAIVSGNKITRVNLLPKEDPIATFEYQKGAIIYEYCNKHGLWKNEVK